MDSSYAMIGRREDYRPAGHRIEHGLITVYNPKDFPMPKWVYHNPIDRGIRYLLEDMDFSRCDRNQNFIRNRR